MSVEQQMKNFRNLPLHMFREDTRGKNVFWKVARPLLQHRPIDYNHTSTQKSKLKVSNFISNIHEIHAKYILMSYFQRVSQERIFKKNEDRLFYTLYFCRTIFYQCRREQQSKAKHKEPIELHLHAPSKLGDNLKNPFNKPDTSCLFDRDLTPY